MCIENIKIELGSTVKDSINGYQGIAIGRAEYLYGEPNVLVESLELKDGKPQVYWIAEARLIVVKNVG